MTDPVNPLNVPVQNVDGGVLPMGGAGGVRPYYFQANTLPEPPIPTDNAAAARAHVAQQSRIHTAITQKELPDRAKYYERRDHIKETAAVLKEKHPELDPGAMDRAAALFAKITEEAHKADMKTLHRKDSAGKNPIRQYYANKDTRADKGHISAHLVNRVNALSGDDQEAFRLLEGKLGSPLRNDGKGLTGMDSIIASVVKLFYDSDKGGVQFTGMAVGALGAAMGWQMTGGGGMGWMGIGATALMAVSGIVFGKMVGESIAKAMEPSKKPGKSEQSYAQAQEQSVEPAKGQAEQKVVNTDIPQNVKDLVVNGKPITPKAPDDKLSIGDTGTLSTPAVPLVAAGPKQEKPASPSV